MDSTLTNDIALLKEMVTSLLLPTSTLEKENEGLRFGERDIKVKQKIAPSFRTLKGVKIYARILSFIKSLRKQEINVFDALQKIQQGIKVDWKLTT